MTEYDDDSSFDQCIRIARIRNPFRVYLDPDRQEPDGSDAEWGFITDLITHEEFRSKYPDAKAVSWNENGVGDEYRNWVTQTHVRVAEYFYFENKKRTLVALDSGHVGYEDELAPEIAAQIKENPAMVTRKREVEVKTCHWDTINCYEVLEENIWAGKWIPIVEVIGNEIDIEGKVTRSGLIRDAKDPQRMYNYWCTAETEMIALAPKAPFIMEEGQVEGHEARWRDANIKSYPYLLYKGTNVAGKQAPPPQRQPFAGPPAGIVNAKAGAAQDMMATTGIRFDATLAERTYDESGKALRELKRVGDLGNFHYVDNLSRSLRHTGRILIDLIPKIYDTRRVATILREDDSEEMVTIDPQQPQAYQKRQGSNGAVEKLFNPKVGKYDVTVSIGPSFSTKRQEAAESMIGFLKVLPNSAQLIGDLIAKNMDWPGADEIATRLASQLPPQVLNKSVDELPPEARAMIGSLQQQLQGLQGERDKAVSLLGDKEADRDIDREKNAIQLQKIHNDFEAKLTDIVAKMQQTLITSVTGEVSGRMDQLAAAVESLEDGLRRDEPKEAKEDAATTAEIVQLLKAFSDPPQVAAPEAVQ